MNSKLKEVMICPTCDSETTWGDTGTVSGHKFCPKCHEHVHHIVNILKDNCYEHYKHLKNFKLDLRR